MRRKSAVSLAWPRFSVSNAPGTARRASKKSLDLELELDAIALLFFGFSESSSNLF